MGNYLKMRKDIFGSDRSWGDLLKLAKSEGDSVAIVQRAIEDSAASILGKPPVFIGYGIIKKYELKIDNLNVVMFSGQNPFYMAEIRGERRALYKRFDLEKQFGAIIPDAELETEFIDAQVEADEEQAPEDTGVPRSAETNLKDLGFTPKQTKQTLSFSVEQRKVLIDAKLADNDFAASGMLGLSILAPEATNEQIAAWGKLYRQYRPDPKAKGAMSSNDAAAAANVDYASEVK